MTTDSQKQERRGAKVYGGTVNAGSGNTSGHKNDVRTDDLSIEFKTTRQKGYYLRLDTLRNAEKEALVDGRDCIFGLDYITSKDGTFRYVIMPEDWFLDLRDQVMEYMLAAHELGDECRRLQREQWVDRGSAP